MTVKSTTNISTALMSAEYTYDVLNRLTNVSFDDNTGGRFYCVDRIG